jgi:hypothetical protein
LQLEIKSIFAKNFNKIKIIMNTRAFFKTTALLLFAALIITGLTGCKKEEMQMKASQCEEVVISYNEFIKLCVEPVKDAKTLEVQMVIENLTKQDIMFDPSFTLEHYADGKWNLISLGIHFEDVLVVLKPGKKSDPQLLVTQTMYDFKAGKYRVNKTIFTEQSSYDFIIGFEIVSVLK